MREIDITDAVIAVKAYQKITVPKREISRHISILYEKNNLKKINR
jgi:hypothetical protein